MKRRDLLLGAAVAPQLELSRIPDARRRNIVLIVTDDHRHDAMSFRGHPFLRTPALDRMAESGCHLENAFVTTALCSPSRATILTGLYAHTHRVVDNKTPESKDLVFFPQYLQAAGYKTSFFGKWHMGADTDAPRRGFNHWVSFPGQGEYQPSSGARLNVNGRHVPQRGYITDELTDCAIEWLRGRSRDPFFLLLSHKAAHDPFIPAERHRGTYANVTVPRPRTQANTPENYRGKPRWVKTQRNSTHGVDYPDQKTVPLEENYKRYCETLLSVDDSVGRVLGELERQGILDSTLVVYLGDNGYQWGEHGLQDKRTAYEDSMRIPMIARCPELFKPGTRAGGMVLNLDLAPTLLEAAGLRAPSHMQGRSFLPLAQGRETAWRDHFLYEYFWERNYPQTPTLHAIRTERYKFIRYHGVWDANELYDLVEDPLETRNLIASAEHRALVENFSKLLFDELESTGGMYIPLFRDRGQPQVMRRARGAEPGEFPPWMIRDE